MRATGIVRRIDDLGRVVIPKEIRIQLRIREGDPLEIFTEKDTVIFKRHSPDNEWGITLDTLKEEIAEHYNYCTSETHEKKKKIFNNIDEIRKMLKELEEYEED